MIAYFDSSALVPLCVEEPGTTLSQRAWRDASRVVTVRLAYPEVRAAFAQAHRQNRLTARQLAHVIDEWESHFLELDIIELTADLAREGGDLAQQHALRGYDAVHLAAAATLDDADLVLVAGDDALLAAAMAQGITTVDTNSH